MILIFEHYRLLTVLQVLFRKWMYLFLVGESIPKNGPWIILPQLQGFSHSAHRCCIYLTWVTFVNFFPRPHLKMREMMDIQDSKCMTCHGGMLKLILRSVETVDDLNDLYQNQTCIFVAACQPLGKNAPSRSRLDKPVCFTVLLSKV